MTISSQIRKVRSRFRPNAAFLCTCLAGLLAFTYFIAAGIVRDRAIVAEWLPSQGTIVSARPEACGKYNYAVRAHFHYRVGSDEYAGDERAAGHGKCGKLKEIERLSKEVVGTTAQLYVNPNNPGEAVMGTPRIAFTRYVLLTASLALIGAALFGLRTHMLGAAPGRRGSADTTATVALT